MTITHNLGFPRIGARRELKFALEAHWRGETGLEELETAGERIRRGNRSAQASLDLVPVGDFSFYDHVLDTSFLVGNIPARHRGGEGGTMGRYFRVARGLAAGGEGHDAICCDAAAGEMTKWFDTNYHYIVPEFDAATEFRADPRRLVSLVREAVETGTRPKPVLLGPVTYLALGKARDGSDRLALLPRLLPVYAEILDALSAAGVEWVQIDEPILATDLDQDWRAAFATAYAGMVPRRVKLLLSTYFGPLRENREIVAALPVDGIHLDAVRGREDVLPLLDVLPESCTVSLGVIDGRNVWKSDLSEVLDWLEPLRDRLGDRLWIAPSCSLLHVPVDLDTEDSLNAEVRSWLSFARQKLAELDILARALREGRGSVVAELDDNKAVVVARRYSPRVNDPAVKAALAASPPGLEARKSPFEVRVAAQAAWLDLPRFPTTTIGSFPQTAEIRQVRARFRSGDLDGSGYEAAIREEIERCVRTQEELGLDVLVHGEPERNDMVEYFGEQLAGFAFTRFGWVQSYGSRCVKPPLLFGDVSRPRPMTVDWIRFASSLTTKPMKGMLTGPVTILNWSFVRVDQPRSETCRQIALAIRDEVLDLERAGVGLIQIDEAALREGLPLRRADWKQYLDWAVGSFRLAANGVEDRTQIHTHMCYSEFNDIIGSIAEMDADVITIETSRSAMELLDAFDDFRYPNDIGPGVYDIHSPNIPSTESMRHLMEQAAMRIPAERLWVNPDCGLKTRRWEEVVPALANMVAAAKELRASI